MDKFRKTFSVRKKKENEASESSKPQLWVEDERKIKEGSCSFQVKYLGCIEVFESRGMQVCEEAIKALRKSKKKAQRAILYVSGDALRVSDEISKHLIVDQTIEKVSFCAPDRGHDKGFAYICRDGATRRWMCHAFLAVKESGERLSHAVGCAFAICLERKQKRERDAVQATYANEDGSFVRMSSFRQTTLSERLLDPQSAIIVDHSADSASRLSHSSETKLDGNNRAVVPFSAGSDKAATLPKLGSGAIPRPRASPSLIERQTSLRLFPKLQETSPFKHSLSMRATLDTGASTTLLRTNLIMNGAATIPEETSTDLEEVSTTLTNYSTTLPITRVSLTPQPSSFAFRNPLSTASPTFPVSFGDANIDTATSTSAALTTTSTSEVKEDTIDTSLLALDPFSAAPVNPATIQQHQAAQKQQLQQGLKGLSSNNASPIIKTAAKVSPTPKVANFPVSEWPEVAVNSAANSSVGASNSRDSGSINVSFGFASAITPSLSSDLQLASPAPTVSTAGNAPEPALDASSSGTTAVSLFGADIKSPVSSSVADSLIGKGTQWPGVTTAPVGAATVPAPWILSSTEPDNFAADPFDIGWAERATAMAQGQLAALSPFPLPLTAPPRSPSTVGNSPCTNPFLVPLFSDGQRLGASSDPGF
ncbi:hypothetical protein Aperf_G00000033974 [Anoplocephala perfoliata]